MIKRALILSLVIGATFGYGQTASAAILSVEGPVSWLAVTQVATGFCTPACSGIESAGDSGISSASSQLTSGGNTASAGAILSSTDYTPELSALADSDRAAVEAFANGVQSYTNLGPSRTILLDLSLSANVIPGTGGTTNAVANVAVFSLASLDTWYRGLGTQLEGDKSSLFGYDSLDPNDAAGDDARTRLSVSGVNGYATPVIDTISFFVEQGQSFLVWAGLEVDARNGGLADASSTLNLNLLESDGTPVDISSLDVASLGSVGVVPLPAGVWLFLSGIGLVAGLSRRRQQSGVH